ncbi:phage major capsid protein [Bremerella sp. P1]|uniref:phage major capsid protein n=1 Tax=Bremerella sp. P1 TaxID=3026424 RepID=UPI002368A98D|nr:phage major capsid protein [Bremerella sp. P1]WDI44779.1 phage major capsid protein [Bremerella sp. P1]
MPSLDQILDLVESTINKYDRKKWVDISLNNQNYHFTKEIVRGGRMKNDANSTACEWKVQTSYQDSTRYADLYDTDTHVVGDHLTNASSKWMKITDNWSFDKDENVFNQGPEQIIDHVMVRQHAMMNGVFEFLENKMWTQPTSDTARPYEILGIPYWIVKNATQGFNGGDPSSANAGAGGILTASVPNWKNYTDTYATVSSTDAIEKVVRAMEFCNFEAPDPHAAHESTKMPSYGLYSTYNFVEELRRHLRGQNDNLGEDAAAMMKGAPYIMSVPVKWVSVLSNSAATAYDSTDPLYGINWNSFAFHSKAGNWMRETKNVQSATQHNVYVNYIDAWGQFVCKNRRTNFVMYQA